MKISGAQADMALMDYSLTLVKKKKYLSRNLINELLEFVDGVVDDLGSRKHIEKVQDIFTNGTGADRQLNVFKETGSLVEVVKIY